MKAVHFRGDEIAGLRQTRGGIPVLALHGWLDNAHSFLPLSRYLDDCDLVAIDFPGHGQSGQRPAGERYHFDDYVFDVLAIADDLQWESLHLLGHSLGGAVATVVAAAAPERVRSLALVEGLGPLSAPAAETAAGWQRSVERSKLRPRRVHADFQAAVAARAANTDLDSHAAETLAHRGLVETEGGWGWRHDLRLTWPSAHRYTEAQVLDLIGAVRAPVLNIHADPPSRVIDAQMMRLRAAALPDSVRLGCPGGHHLHMHHPDRIGPAIKEHFSRHEPGKPFDSD